MDDSNGSSSSSESEHEFGAQPRARAPKFNPGPAESNAIYFQLCTDIPYTHSRTGQKPTWVRHLLSLKRQGLCLGIAPNSYKTLVKWVNVQCKKWFSFRAKEKRTSGTAAIMAPQVIDTVTHYWHANKISTDLMCEASLHHAQVIREAATTTNTSLISRASAIQRGRDASHRARTPRVLSAIDGEGDEHSDSNQSARGTFLSPPSNHLRRQQHPNSSTHAHEVREILLQMNSPLISQADVNQAAAIVQQNIIANSTVINGTSTQPPVSSAAAPPPPPVLPVAAVAPSASKTERLRELAIMLETEIITQEEYASARLAIIRS
jgi:hypothetical protein